MTLSNADLVSVELKELWEYVEETWGDGEVSPCEKQRARARYRQLQRRARRGALMLRVGHHIARNADLDKNLNTMVKALCEDEEKAANGCDPFTADLFELAA